MNLLRRMIPIGGLAVVAAATIAGCATTETMTSDGKPSLTLSDQPLGERVIIDSMTLDKPGFVVIHKDAGGKPGPVIGRSELTDAGSYRNFPVKFDRGQAGQRVFPMLHYDNGDGLYEFPGPDGPVKVDGKVLVGPVNWK